jgi:hypothetical protein
VSDALASEGDAGYEMLSSARGGDLARSYALMQVTMHAEVLPLFDEMDADVDDPQVRAFLRDTRGAVERHLDAALSLASD